MEKENEKSEEKEIIVENLEESLNKDKKNEEIVKDERIEEIEEKKDDEQKEVEKEEVLEEKEEKKSEITEKKSNKPSGTIINIDKTGIYVNTKDFIIKLTDIKLEGKKRCHVKDFVNGIKIEEYIGKELK